MEYNDIIKILDRYFEGQTSVNEESWLQDYFKGDQVDKKLEKYQILFQ